MLIFRGLHIGLRKEKIQGTYFKICALNFEICPTYFDASAKVMKILHYKIIASSFVLLSTLFIFE